MEESDWGNRPLGISVLAMLDLVGGILALVGGGLVVTGSSTPTIYGHGAITGLAAMIVGVLFILLGILLFAAGWGGWSGKGWAWTLNIILGGLAIVIYLFSIVLGEWSYVVGLVIEPYILWYLWRPHVKAYFGKDGQPVST